LTLELAEKFRDENTSRSDKQDILDEMKKIAAQRAEMGAYSRLYSPLTGEYYDKEKAPSDAVDYETRVKEKAAEYTDLEKAYKAAENASHTFDYYEKELNSPVEYVGANNQPVKLRYTYKDLLNKGLLMQIEERGGRIPQEAITKSKKLREEYLNSKINVEAISRAIMLNEDPADITRGFFGESGFLDAVEKGISETIAEGTVQTGEEAEFLEGFTNAIRQSGEEGLITKAQEGKLEETFTEKLGYGVGASMPIMGEIIAASALLETGLTAPVIARRLSQFKNLFGTSKAGKLFGNIVEGGMKGYASFAPTSEEGTTGIGEGVVQGALDSFLPENLIGGKYGRLLNMAIRVGVGGTAESLQELAGQYTNALSKQTGFDPKQAFYDAFGRTPEERWDILRSF
jgi:hypothetical protein